MAESKPLHSKLKESNLHRNLATDTKVEVSYQLNKSIRLLIPMKYRRHVVDVLSCPEATQLRIKNNQVNSRVLCLQGISKV